MKFEIPLPDGRLLCIQFVRRVRRDGSVNVYTRQCADTFRHPTPAQAAVRKTLSMGAAKAFDGSGEDVLVSVEREFQGWVRRSPENRSKVERYLNEIFPDDTQAVKAYLEAM